MFESKNIIILLKAFVLGGAEKQALFLAGYLQNERNCNVFIYSYIKSNSRELFDAECEKYGLTNLYLVSNPLSASGKYKFLKIRVKLFLLGLKLRKHTPDIIIPYLNPPSIIAGIIYKISGAKKTFWHHRGVDYYRNDSLEKLAIRKIKLFIANSLNGAEEIKNKLGVEANKIHVIPNFLTFKPSSKESYPSKKNSKDELIIGMIAHFRREKRQLLLLKSCLQLFEKYPNLKLYLIGDFYEEKLPEEFIEIERIIKRNKLESKVSIYHNTKTKDIINRIDIGVLISDKEGMPNVIMEYMANELAVVSSKHSGCKQLLGESYPFLVENNSKSITNSLEELIENDEIRQRTGKDNYQKIISNFSFESYLRNLTRLIYES